jgi:retron-type reverse transcriptase
MIALDLSLENLYRQYYSCRKNKRNTINALRFEVEQEKNLLTLREELIDGTYQPRRSVCFFTTRPKLREILAADFRDRVVHHLLVDHLEARWEPVFIHDSYACRTGKGVHKAVQRLQQFIRQVTANGVRSAWYLQLDIRNYFMSIDRDILFAMLAPGLSDDKARWLTHMLVYHDVTVNCHVRGRPETLARIPAHKTLFGAAPNKGLPIGNLNSQFFANVYLNALDQFVKHALKCRHYLRYCDDFVLLANNPEQLRDWQARIEHYLAEQLVLELNPKQRLAPVSDGIDFLGYIVRRDYRLVRRRVVNNLHAKLRDYESQLVSTRGDVHCYRFDVPLLDALMATLSSYLGHFKLANTWNLCQSLWAKYAFLAQYFEFDVGQWKLVRKYPVPAGLRQVRQQYRYFRWRFPHDTLFFRVGRFFEFYDVGESPQLACLGMQKMRWNRRGARYGFPLRNLTRALSTVLERGDAVLLIGEADGDTGGIRRRVPVCRFAPVSHAQKGCSVGNLVSGATDRPVSFPGQ